MRSLLRTRSLILLLLAAVIFLVAIAPLSASSVGLSFWALFFLPALFFIGINLRRSRRITGSILGVGDRPTPQLPSRYQRPPPFSIP